MIKHMMSQELKIKIKFSDQPAYKLAQQAGLDPSTLSKLLCGIVRIKPNDARVIAVGKVLGLKSQECFEQVDQKLKRISGKRA